MRVKHFILLVGFMIFTCNTFAFEALYVQVPGQSELVIQTRPRPVVVWLQSKLALMRDLNNAEAIFSLTQQAIHVRGKHYLMLVTQIPSARPRTSFCGSGTEDYLKLIEIDQKRKRLIQKDAMLIQSCLKSIVLQDDQATPLPKLLASKLDASHQLKLQWLSHPEIDTTEKTIAIENSKLITH